MKKNFVYAIIIMVISFLSILMFQFILKTEELNGFNRTIKEHKFNIDKIIHLPSSNCYFAYITRTKIYLKNIGAQSQLFSLDYSLNNLKEYDLKLAGNAKFSGKKINIGIKDSTIYITNRIGGLTFLNINTLIWDEHNYENSGLMFDQSYMLSKKSLAIRQTIIKENQLGRNLSKYNFVNNKIENSYHLEKQIDGFFCTDGLLKYDSDKTKLFYLFIYRGTYLCLDTNLNLLYKAKTIDTVSTTKMEIKLDKKVLKNKSVIYTTQSKPPKQVNRNCTIYKDRIYILSMLKADNETPWNFNRNQVVDVYGSNKGDYLYSFYIPKYKGMKPRELRIDGNRFFSIYDDMLVSYILNI